MTSVYLGEEFVSGKKRGLEIIHTLSPPLREVPQYLDVGTIIAEY